MFIFKTYNVTSNECIAGNGWILERSVQVSTYKEMLQTVQYIFTIPPSPKSAQTKVEFINGFAPLRPTFEKLFTGANVVCRAQKISAGRKTVYEINPRL